MSTLASFPEGASGLTVVSLRRAQKCCPKNLNVNVVGKTRLFFSGSHRQLIVTGERSYGRVLYNTVSLVEPAVTENLGRHRNFFSVVVQTS